MSDAQRDLSQRAPWLRAAVLGATDGLISLSCLMIGFGSAELHVGLVIMVGLSGLVAGALSMAIGEYVSVSHQLEVERNGENEANQLPSPIRASLASGIAFSFGAILPVLAGAFLRDKVVRFGVLVGVTCLELLMFGWVSAVLGNASVRRSCLRLFIGGSLAMAISFGMSQLVSSFLVV
ncbi:hypothetical protein ACHQM5_017934 [Ranunculus cassubicifolius]